MSRVQLALNVSNLDDAIEFYSKFFKTQPSKIRDGYANFAIEEPPLKLVLVQNEGTPGSLNHLGVEVFSSEEVTDASSYMSSVGLVTHVQESTTCCFAVQDKVWVDGVDGSPWEVYAVLEDSTSSDGIKGDGSCCVTSDANAGAACC